MSGEGFLPSTLASRNLYVDVYLFTCRAGMDPYVGGGLFVSLRRARVEMLAAPVDERFLVFL